MWVLTHMDDVASDLSAVHGVRDVGRLSGRAFFKLAHRLPAYRGVMREHALRQQARDDEPVHSAPSRPDAVQPPRRPRRMVLGTREGLASVPEFRGVFSFGTTKPPEASEPPQPS